MSRNERAQVALDLENNRLVAVGGAVEGGQLRLIGWTIADRPATMAAEEAPDFGAWIAAELKRAGLWAAARRGGIVFAVPRAEVVLKRIGLPGAVTGAELPSLVRLQMLRQLTVSGESAAIDFIPLDLPARPARGTPAESRTSAVLAGALQGDRLAWRQSLARAAGLKVARVGLRSEGAAALLAEGAQRRGGATLGIALGGGSAELLVVEEGQLVFARATDLFRTEPGGDAEGFAQRLAVEAKRTLMSYRGNPEAAPLEAVVVLGADETARLVAERCEEALGLRAHTTDYPAFVAAPRTMPPGARTALAPLVGLLAEPVTGRPVLDFAAPRRAPDVAAARRQRALLAAAALVILGGSGATLARLDLARRQDELDQLKAGWAESAPRHAAYLRARARLDHLRQFVASEADWLAHLEELSRAMPDTRLAVLDRLDATGRVEVVFKPKERRQLPGGSWETRFRGLIQLSGSASRRDVADALRARLVQDQRYTLQTRGADTPDRFDWVLVTASPRPLPPEAAPAPNGAAAAAEPRAHIAPGGTP
ncbi:MAG TPA: hypothetical protein VD963_00805 [Phycisphaerales bacterium]|nr:hypothetical protein [Phycisphaerales bacterium]